MMDELPNEIKELSADNRGRVCLGTEYQNQKLRVAIVEVVKDE